MQRTRGKKLLRAIERRVTPSAQVLGQIEATIEEAARLGLDAPAPAKASDTDRVAKPETIIRSGRVQPTVRGLPVPGLSTRKAQVTFLPRLKARMDELGLHAAVDLAGIAGKRRGGARDCRGF